MPAPRGTRAAPPANPRRAIFRGDCFEPDRLTDRCDRSWIALAGQGRRLAALARFTTQRTSQRSSQRSATLSIRLPKRNSPTEPRLPLAMASSSQLQSAASNRMPSACMICTATSGNGPPTGSGRRPTANLEVPFRGNSFRVAFPRTRFQGAWAIHGDKIDQFFEILAPTNVHNGCPLNGRN